MKMMVIVFLIMLAPVSAVALSCTPHSVQGAFLDASADKANYIVVRGKLKFDVRKLPKTGQNTAPQLTRINAELSGFVLSRRGFKTPYNNSVILEVACFGPWCASAQEGGEVLAFVKQDAEGDVVATNPCSGYLFSTPTPKMIRAVKRCLTNKGCKPPR